MTHGTPSAAVRSALVARFERKDAQKYLEQPAPCSAFGSLGLRRACAVLGAITTAVAVSACGGNSAEPEQCAPTTLDGTKGVVCDPKTPQPPATCATNPDVCR